jgi:hypothetical protein
MDTTKPPLMEKILQVPIIIARYVVGIPLMAIGIGLTISAIIDIWNVLFGSEYYESFWEFFDDYLIFKFIGPLIAMLGWYIIDPEGAIEAMNDSDSESGSETNSAPSETSNSIIIDEEDESEPIDWPLTRP